jgi:hypothetical protein
MLYWQDWVLIFILFSNASRLSLMIAIRVKYGRFYHLFQLKIFAALEICPQMIKALDRRAQANEHLGNNFDALVGTIGRLNYIISYDI